MSNPTRVEIANSLKEKRLKYLYPGLIAVAALVFNRIDTKELSTVDEVILYTSLLGMILPTYSLLHVWAWYDFALTFGFNNFDDSDLIRCCRNDKERFFYNLSIMFNTLVMLLSCLLPILSLLIWTFTINIYLCFIIVAFLVIAGLISLFRANIGDLYLEDLAKINGDYLFSTPYLRQQRVLRMIVYLSLPDSRHDLQRHFRVIVSDCPS